MGVQTARVRLLRECPPFRRLWISRFVSLIGDSLALVALILYVAARTNEGFAVAALLLASDFAPTLLSPWTGALADRLDMRALMLTAETIQAVAVVAMAFTLGSLPIVFALVVTRSVLASTFVPASRSAVPRLVADTDLEAANAVLGFGSFGFEAVGAAIAAALVPLIGTRGALLVDAGTFAVSAFVLLGLPALAPDDHHENVAGATSWHRDALDGVRGLLVDPLVRAVVIGFGAVVACIGMDDVVLVFLARRNLHAGSSGTAFIYAGAGVGLFFGFLTVARMRRALPSILLVGGLALAAAGDLLTGLAWATYAAFAMQVVRGLGISAIDVGHSTLLQRSVAPERLGRTFANLYGVIGLAAGASYLAGGALLHVASPRVVLVIGGAGGLAAAAGTAVMLGAVARGRSPRSNPGHGE
jgi:MFS family permease